MNSFRGRLSISAASLYIYWFTVSLAACLFACFLAGPPCVRVHVFALSLLGVTSG
jgi:hypothetical protein